MAFAIGRKQENDFYDIKLVNAIEKPSSRSRVYRPQILLNSSACRLKKHMLEQVYADEATFKPKISFETGACLQRQLL